MIKMEKVMQTVEELKQEARTLDAQIKAMEGRWPEVGDEYWMAHVDGPVARIWKGTDAEVWWKSLGDVYMSKDDAAYATERLQALFILVREVAAYRQDNAWFPDFSITQQVKCCPVYNYETKTLSVWGDPHIVCGPPELMAPRVFWENMNLAKPELVKLWLRVTE